MTMASLPWLALAATIACSTGGNTLANWSHRFGGRKRLLVLGSAIGVHVTGLLCFSVALAGIPLAIAYPALIGGTVACVCILAATLFGERLSGRHLGGLALIIVGMTLLHGPVDGARAYDDAHARAVSEAR
jgi:multidrug transporter EmrE-like cation transporter